MTQTAPVPPAKVASAGPGVSLHPVLLDMPGLDRNRQIRIYVPPGYAASDKRYPVLYMHDAQNLFDDLTAYAGEWKVDEMLDQLSRSGQLELIVVGIDNGPRRGNELNGWYSPHYGVAEGRQYMDFIVNVVKPMIDQTYRTRPEPAQTGVMGASMGGVISHYAIKQYPGVFGKAGIFSPYYFRGPDSFNDIATRPASKDARLYMLMGGAEIGTIVPEFEQVYASVLAGGHPPANVVKKTIPQGGHNEALWTAEFVTAVLWLFANP